jgi:hypothetical protein
MAGGVGVPCSYDFNGMVRLTALDRSIEFQALSERLSNLT